MKENISEETTGSFKLGADNLSPEPELSSVPEPDELPETETTSHETIDKLRRRVGTLFFLVSFLIAIVAFLVFLISYEKVITSREDESQKLAELSQRLEERFSSLSVRQAKLEDDSQKTTATFQNTTGRLEKKLQESVSKVENGLSGKIGKEELQKNLAGYQEQVNNINTAITAMKTPLNELKTVKEDFKAETKTLSAKLYETVEDMIKLQEQLTGLEGKIKSATSADAQLKGTVEALQRDQMGKREVVEQLQAIRGELSQQMDKVKRGNMDLENRYKSLDGKITQLENALAVHERDLVRIKLDLKFLKSPGTGTRETPSKSVGVLEKPL